MPRSTHTSYCYTAVLVLACVSTAISARGDECVFTFEASASSANGRYELKAWLDREQGTWKATLKDTKFDKGIESTLEKLGRHQHCSVYVTDDGSRVVVFEPRVSDSAWHCVMVYNRKLELLKSFGVLDLLTDEDTIRFSISHVQFTERDPKRKSTAWLEGKTFAFTARNGRTVRLALHEPKVLGRPKTGDSPASPK